MWIHCVGSDEELKAKPWDAQIQFSVSNRPKSSSVGSRKRRWEKPTETKIEANLFMPLRQVLAWLPWRFLQQRPARAKNHKRQTIGRGTQNMLNPRKWCRMITSAQRRTSSLLARWSHQTPTMLQGHQWSKTGQRGSPTRRDPASWWA